MSTSTKLIPSTEEGYYMRYTLEMNQPSKAIKINTNKKSAIGQKGEKKIKKKRLENEARANATKKERERAEKLRKAFARLRNVLPLPIEERTMYSKRNTLELAASYIETLEAYVDWSQFNFSSD